MPDAAVPAPPADDDRYQLRVVIRRALSRTKTSALGFDAIADQAIDALVADGFRRAGVSPQPEITRRQIADALRGVISSRHQNVYAAAVNAVWSLHVGGPAPATTAPQGGLGVFERIAQDYAGALLADGATPAGPEATDGE